MTEGAKRYAQGVPTISGEFAENGTIFRSLLPTPSDPATPGHLKVNCPEGAREATLGCVASLLAIITGNPTTINERYSCRDTSPEVSAILGSAVGHPGRGVPTESSFGSFTTMTAFPTHAKNRTHSGAVFYVQIFIPYRRSSRCRACSGRRRWPPGRRPGTDSRWSRSPSSP